MYLWLWNYCESWWSELRPGMSRRKLPFEFELQSIFSTLHNIGMRPFLLVDRRSQGYICRTCRQTRLFSHTSILTSGHSKWATIKHDKARNDAATSRQRSAIAKEITFAVKRK
jgi:hypothetical protein